MRDTWSSAGTAGSSAAAATGLGLMGYTAGLTGTAANLGGYVTAQVVAGSVGAGGPWLSAAIAATGGPVVAGALAAAGVGYGVYKLVSWLSD